MPMAANTPSQLENLLERSAAGDPGALDELFSMYRERLKRMIAVQLDPRIAHRVDDSDVVQETFAEAAQRLPDYMRTRKVGFYPWLRQLALDHIISEQRKHLGAQMRSVGREQSSLLSDQSAVQLAQRLVGSQTSPSRQLLRQEARMQVRDAIDRLKGADREVLVLRFLEQLTTKETADVLGLTVRGVKSRQRRAIERLTRLLRKEDRDEST